ncbi:peptidase domain-containing ABC transporter [Thalassolituus oleivorans]|uniref:peptidase domain-containing ABC transporter n=1 Tax=Thalassolituus oleivorans TaxID=187493 RepID=UPI0030C8105B
MSSPISLLQFSGKHKVPVIQQTAMAECGLACLAMVGSFHGYKTDLNSLRRRFPVTLRGVTLKGLMATADRLNFASRPLKLDIEEMKELQLPAILHWNLNHFVVLVAMGRGTITIHDPAQGRRVLSIEEVSKHFTGIALELTPAPGFKEVDDRKSMRLTDFWTRISGFRSTLAQVLALSVALQFFSLGGPYFTQLVVDEAIVSRDVNLITVLALGFGLLMLIEVSTSLLRSWVVLIFSSLLNIQMANNLFRHLIRLPMSYFENRHIGDTVSRFQSLHKIRAMFTTGFIEAFVDGGMSIMLVVLMFLYSPQLAFVVLGFTLAFLILRLVLFQPFRDLTEENIINAAKEQSNFMETVRGIQSVKLFGKELDRQSLWQSRYADLVNTDIRLGKFNITFQTANSLLFGLENIVVISIAANTVLDASASFSVGMLYAFVAYKRQFTGKAQSLISKVIEFKMLKLHLERIADIAKTPIETDLENNNLDEGGKLTGALSLEKLSYRYTPQDAPIFHDLDLSVKAGESLALVGPSGVGKTTLLKVMLGLLKPESGSVLMETNTDVANPPAESKLQEIRELGLSKYRSQIAAVMQEDQLMSGTIADNICFFDTHPDHAWIEACAHLACLLPDIQAMPMGFNSLVGDMGTSLSGGQKQRLMLARALYRRPRILFLDEASSHLDVKTEAQVNANLGHLGITRVVIAHRQATIDMAERVLSLQNGKLVAL